MCCLLVVQESEADVVERAVLEHAGEGPSTSGGGEPSKGAAAAGAFDMVAASEWLALAEELVLLSPSQCRTLWRQFSSDTSYAVQQVPYCPTTECLRAIRLTPFFFL